MYKAEELHASPNALAPFYSRFRVDERLLLTGHSHQAWPDQGFDGQCQAWFDAAEWADEKWERAFAKADRVREGYARLLDDDPERIALSESTHDLVIRFLSGLPLKKRPRLVTTDGEFHTLRRQLDRLAEEGLEVEKVPSLPAAGVAERLTRSVNEKTAAVLVSAVFFQNSQIVPDLASLHDACRKQGAALLIDTYHALNVLPFSLKAEGLEGAYVVGGGYKYCQLGEGNSFLRFPPDCTMRPVITGWFSEFDRLAEKSVPGRVGYGRGASRFNGATYDPTSHYRAAGVFDFFVEQELAPEFLREVSQHQVKLIAEQFDALDADPEVITRDRNIPLKAIGGFLVLRSAHAGTLYRLLLEEGVQTDFRDDVLRLGPAPYLSDEQIIEAVGILGEILRKRGKELAP
ncbi:MAG: kynureninase/PvdN C-terminal domain-containing protein [Planctomycetota bacterium]|jgi:kynureninase